MLIIIDNYDSFTYNLFQQIKNLGVEVKVLKNDKTTLKELEKLNPKQIVISPGPGRPEDSGISPKVIKKFYKKTPILGVCLGHQTIGEVFGVKVIHAKSILHGKTSNIYHTEDKLFTGAKNPFKAARYHSLAIEEVPKGFELTAWDESDEIMAIHHQRYPLYGIQFHPESFMTTEGTKIMKNFLNAH